MNPEFQRCLERKKIVPFEKGHTLVEKELRTAHEDLEIAKQGLSFEKFKWPTIQAYYSQFHSARALLYSRGYREKSHFCLLVAIKAIFVAQDLLKIEYTDAFYAGMILREKRPLVLRPSQTFDFIVVSSLEGPKFRLRMHFLAPELSI